MGGWGVCVARERCWPTGVGKVRALHRPQQGMCEAGPLRCGDELPRVAVLARCTRAAAAACRAERCCARHQFTHAQRHVTCHEHARPHAHTRTRATRRISILGLKTFAPGVPLTLRGKRPDGSTYEFPVNQTFNDNQVGIPYNFLWSCRCWALKRPTQSTRNLRVTTTRGPVCRSTGSSTARR